MEKLTVKNLGPIKDFTMETNRLTVLIGPQASGKSLLAQMLYFFRGGLSLVAEHYGAEIRETFTLSDSISHVLNDMRASEFFDFCSEFSSAEFIDLQRKHRYGKLYFYGPEEDEEDDEKQDGSLDGNERYADCGWCEDVDYEWLEYEGELFDHIAEKMEEWKVNKSALTRSLTTNQIYIPNERSFLSRLINKRQSVLYAEYQPLVLRKFAEHIENARNMYFSGAHLKRVRDQYLLPGMLDISPALVSGVILSLQRNALSGSINVSRELGSQWIWNVEKANKRLLLESLSSGQSEAWPFFALASTFGVSERKYDFYFEEPETHLHPKAQVEVVKTIAYLISRGHRFVITTHSPFILYVINNLIQAHIAYDGTPPEGEFSINPDHVAAYCLGDNPRSIVKPDTRLLELREIDSVFDKLNVDFERYMDMEFAREGK